MIDTHVTSTLGVSSTWHGHSAGADGGTTPRWPVTRLLPHNAGDAMLIQTPSGASILIDGGSDPVALVSALGHKLPFWKRSIDAVILTAPDHAHLPGLVAAIARYHIVRAIAPPSRSSGALATEWQRRLAEQRTPLQIVRTGSTFRIDRLQFRVLSRGDGTTSGMLLRLDYGSTGVVFAHNSGADDEQDLATHGLRPASLVVFPWQRDPRTDFITAIAPKSDCVQRWCRS